MAITNVISSRTNIFKDIIVKNSTHKNLSKIYLTYDRGNRPMLKISDLPKGQQLKKSILVSHLTNPTKLLLITEDNDETKEITAFDNLSNTDLKTLTLTIKEDNDDITVIASEN